MQEKNYNIYEINQLGFIKSIVSLHKTIFHKIILCKFFIAKSQFIFVLLNQFNY